MYKLHKFSNDTEIKYVLKTNENGWVTCIPFNTENTDYQAYLAWLAEGNTPLPAEAA